MTNRLINRNTKRYSSIRTDRQTDRQTDKKHRRLTHYCINKDFLMELFVTDETKKNLFYMNELLDVKTRNSKMHFRFESDGKTNIITNMHTD